MTSGRPLTDREQMHILRWANRKTWGQIADELVEQSPDGGRRNPVTLSMWYSRYCKEVKTIEIEIPKSVLKEIHQTNIDKITLSFIVTSAIHSYLNLIPLTKS